MKSPQRLDSIAKLIQQMQDHADPGNIHLELFGQRADHSHAPQCVAVVEHLDPSAHAFDSRRRDQFLALPRSPARAR